MAGRAPRPRATAARWRRRQWWETRRGMDRRAPRHFAATGSGFWKATRRFAAQAPRRASRPAPSSSPILAGGEAATAHAHAHAHLMRAAALTPWQPEAAAAHSHAHAHSHARPPLLPPAAPSTPPPQAPLFRPAHPQTRTQQPRARRRAAPRVPGARPAAGKERPGSGAPKAKRGRLAGRVKS